MKMVDRFVMQIEYFVSIRIVLGIIIFLQQNKQNPPTPKITTMYEIIYQFNSFCE